MKRFVCDFLIKVGRCFSPLHKIKNGGGYLLNKIYSGYISGQFKLQDNNSFSCEAPVYIGGGECITIMSGHLRRGCRISAIKKYAGVSYKPQIIIGANFNLGINTHIGAINCIKIGDNFLSGANCLITDHTHGSDLIKECDIAPVDRELFSKGEVIIGNNVFMGENSIVLPNVHIGNNVIIGASTVVTKNIPSNSIAVGNPMRIIQY